ncbi:MAG: hypothetical protein PHH49_07435 [Candidatus Omnitrophica bacterium]|nr:hypothetical protein [Candidatus Omnitrophota bacterium]MDD5488767.1 hypothetical protein [Candidatus Omnitrophota bacterium]
MIKKAITFMLTVSIICASFIMFNANEAGARSMFFKDADNKVCPVTGKTIDRKRFNTAYDGKRYWFSSYDAVLEFQKNPSKYVKKVDSSSASSNSYSRVSKPEPVVAKDSATDNAESSGRRRSSGWWR